MRKIDRVFFATLALIAVLLVLPVGCDGDDGRPGRDGVDCVLQHPYDGSGLCLGLPVNDDGTVTVCHIASPIQCSTLDVTCESLGWYMDNGSISGECPADCYATADNDEGNDSDEGSDGEG